MKHATGYGNNLFVAEFVDESGTRTEDRSSESEGSKVAFPDSIQFALLGENNVVFLAALNLLDLIALKGEYYVMDG